MLKEGDLSGGKKKGKERVAIIFISRSAWEKKVAYEEGKRGNMGDDLFCFFSSLFDPLGRKESRGGKGGGEKNTSFITLPSARKDFTEKRTKKGNKKREGRKRRRGPSLYCSDQKEMEWIGGGGEEGKDRMNFFSPTCQKKKEHRTRQKRRACIGLSFLPFFPPDA